MIESSEKDGCVGGTVRQTRSRSVVRLQIPIQQEETQVREVEDEVARAVETANRASTSAPAAQASAESIPEITMEDLTAFAEQIDELVDHARYRVIARAMEVDLARAEAASRRIPPPRLRLAD